jgi:exodeoxyribonuclease VII small subunit
VSSQDPTFEAARDELEAIVRKLEDGQTSLDEALALWERGEQLHELCRAKLDQAEQRVAELLERMRHAQSDQP